jgi:hypothetical protein
MEFTFYRSVSRLVADYAFGTGRLNRHPAIALNGRSAGVPLSANLHNAPPQPRAGGSNFLLDGHDLDFIFHGANAFNPLRN